MRRHIKQYKPLARHTLWSRQPVVNHFYSAVARATPKEKLHLHHLTIFLPAQALAWIFNVVRYLCTPRYRFPGADQAPQNSRYTVPEQLRVNIAGDWGTGTEEAHAVAVEMMKWDDGGETDLTVHIGDIYYAGGTDEVKQNCLGGAGKFPKDESVCWPGGRLGSFALNGNHEMYAKGRPYFKDFLPTLGMKGVPGGQGTSYFCLENRYWRILGVDTGYNSASVICQPRCNLPDPLMDWLAGIIPKDDQKATILVSHQQYFSAFEDNYPVPARQLSQYFGKWPVLWLWGHEHRSAAYGLHQLEGVNLKAHGRCIGHGGMPVEANPPSGKPENTGPEAKLLFADQRINPFYRDGAEDPPIGINGFAQLSFDGPRLTIRHKSLVCGHGNGNHPAYPSSTTLLTEVFECAGPEIKWLGFQGHLPSIEGLTVYPRGKDGTSGPHSAEPGPTKSSTDNSSMKTTSEKKPGIEFTETMKGFFVRDAAIDFQQLESQRPANASAFEFTLTIRSEDLDALLNNPQHEAVITGTVSSPALAPAPMVVSGGVFNLFTENRQQVETRNMVYRFPMAGPNGEKYFLDGYKVVQDRSLLNVWHDTTTLYITLYQGTDNRGPALGRGILHIEPADFLKQLTTMQVINVAGETEKLRSLARFGSFFAGVLWQHYGGVFAGTSAFNPDTPPRRKRPLRAPAPEFHPFVTEDGVTLLLTRYRGGNKGPVILAHGHGVSSLIFSTDTIETNLTEFLCARGYDVWLLELRFSIALEASRKPSDGDQVARYDYPAAVAKVRDVTGAKDVQLIVHCWGATTFFMAMLAGLEGVRSFVSSQIGTYFHSPLDVSLKTGLHVPQIFDALGIKQLDAEATTNEKWWLKLYDGALKLPAMIFAQGRCTSATCHRITFMYASLYNHDQLNELAHENLHELFGIGNMRAFEHIAAVGRAGKVVDFSGRDVYLPNFDRLNLPVAFVHGEQNHCFLPEGTQKTFDQLCSRFGPANYSRHVIPGYGHIDCIFGKNAVRDVYPFIVEHLDKTNP